MARQSQQPLFVPAAGQSLEQQTGGLSLWFAGGPDIANGFDFIEYSRLESARRTGSGGATNSRADAASLSAMSLRQRPPKGKGHTVCGFSLEFGHFELDS